MESPVRSPFPHVYDLHKVLWKRSQPGLRRSIWKQRGEERALRWEHRNRGREDNCHGDLSGRDRSGKSTPSPNPDSEDMAWQVLWLQLLVCGFPRRFIVQGAKWISKALILQGLGLQLLMPPNFVNKVWAALAIKPPAKKQSSILLSYFIIRNHGHRYYLPRRQNQGSYVN